MTEKQPIYILPENASRILGRDAQRNNILAARIIADTIKTTLGPKGMDKMLVSSTGDITVTNDGVTILEEMEIEHPAAKMMVEIAKTQDKEVGDGTTSAVMIAGKLLENAEKLLDSKIHPTVITKGYRLAAEKSQELINSLAININEDNKILTELVYTSLASKNASSKKEKFASILVKAVKQISDNGKIDLNNIKIEKVRGEGIEDTELIEGIVLDKEKVSMDMPSKITDAKIALIESALEIKGPETEAKISISTPEQLQSFINQEEKTLKEMVSKIIESGANVIFCQKGIDEIAQYYLSKYKIYACRRISKSDMEKLAMATGGKIISKIAELSQEHLGHAEIVEEVKNNETSYTYIRGCRNPKAMTILIRGGTEHVISEIERALKDGMGVLSSVLKDKKILPGAGAIEVELARKLREYATSIGGREQLAIEEFASALEFIPITLAENAGFDPIDTITELRARHGRGESNAGINLISGKIEDSILAGVIEPIKIKQQAINSASEVAVMILRIDDVISSGKGRANSPRMNEMSGME
ncbi:TCP-1/cpn60 chaperonin family protein [Candidatus Pacearchaeota archaeon]|nr:TCP-1/cpn60 chaperonin family protein [Candidatus Pacearchaeota archaeon]